MIELEILTDLGQYLDFKGFKSDKTGSEIH